MVKYSQVSNDYILLDFLEEILMKNWKTITTSLVALAMPLTVLPLNAITTVSAASTDTQTTKKTYTGTASGSLKTVKKTAYHSKDSKGNIYKADFMADKPTVTLTKKATLDQYRTTWYVTKKMSVKVGHDKNRTYYYITSSDKKVSGWTWSGYLYKGQFKSAD